MKIKVPPLLSSNSALTLITISLALIFIGIVLVYTSSSLYAERLTSNANYFLTRHIVHLVIGIFIFRLVSRVHFTVLRKFTPLLILITFFMLIFVLVPGVGTKVLGARRWLRIGFIGIQPSEILKFVFIIWVASFLDRRKQYLTFFSRGLLPGAIVLGVFIFLLLLQPDFGTSVLLTFVFLTMIFLAGVKPFHIIVSLIGMVSGGFFLVVGSAYRMRRITSFLDPWADPYDSGYQLISSFIAYGTGGLLGKGLGNSNQKLLYLPQAHTDFIFSVIAEETGLIGVLVVLVLYLAFAAIGFRIAKLCKDEFGRNVAFGITTIIVYQALIHICVVTGLMPTKGIGLPLISYGGSSMITVLLMLGVLSNIARTADGKLNEP